MTTYTTCGCHGEQSDGNKCNHGTKRCRRHAQVQLRISSLVLAGKAAPGPWFSYCIPCARAIQESGMTNPTDGRWLGSDAPWQAPGVTR